MNKLLSVVVPIYNVEKVLSRCIESLINQTYKNLEILLVDDGSKDGSASLIDEYARKDSRIVPIHKPNGGSATARNVGLNKATGYYITFVDSDDYVEFDAYETMIDAINRNNADIAVCGRFDDYPDGRQVPSFTAEKEGILTNEEAFKKILLWDEMDISPCDKVYKKELWNNVHFPEGQNVEDIKTLPVVIKNASKIVHIGSRAMYHYVHREGSITTTFNLTKIKDFRSAFLTLNAFTINHFPNIKDELIFYMNHSYLDLLIMCEKIKYKGEEYLEAKAYLKKNWNNKFSKSHFSSRDKLAYFLIKIHLFRIISKIL